MPRKNRVWYPYAMYHITSRGNRRTNIFLDEKDYMVYLRILRETLEYYLYEYEIISYCLMTNHVHLQVKTKETHIKHLMSRLNCYYAKYFNNKYNYVGHLFQDRYASEVIENDRYILEVSRYIHLNPVRAAMVKKPEDYRWSSYSMYIGNVKEGFIASDMILGYNKEKEERKLYREYVESAL